MDQASGLNQTGPLSMRLPCWMFIHRSAGCPKSEENSLFSLVLGYPARPGSQNAS
jgi:hypothetical protein